MIYFTPPKCVEKFVRFVLLTAELTYRILRDGRHVSCTIDSRVECPSTLLSMAVRIDFTPKGAPDPRRGPQYPGEMGPGGAHIHGGPKIL